MVVSVNPQQVQFSILRRSVVSAQPTPGAQIELNSWSRLIPYGQVASMAISRIRAILLDV